MVDNEGEKLRPGAEKAREKEALEKAGKIEDKEVAEVVEGVEVPAFVEGKVSEKAKEDKKAGPAGPPTASGGAAFDLSKVQIPKVEIMREQISTRINAEIKELEREVRKIRRSPKFSPFELTVVVSKVRYLRDLLAKIAYSTAETLKDLWLKYVKGISLS